MTPERLLARYAQMKRRASQRIKNGAISTHPGFKEEWKNRVTLAVTFDAEFVATLHSALKKSGLLGSMDHLLGGRDFPMHMTILDATLTEEVAPNRFPRVFHALKAASSQNLVGLDVDLSHLIDDGLGSTILASHIGQPLFVHARTMARTIFKEAGFTPLPLDIFHCTLLRITGQRESQVMQSWHKEVKRLDALLRRNPLNARIDGVTLDQTYHFLTEGPTTVPRPPKN